MATYQIVKTVSYELTAEVTVESEREVYELLDDNAIGFEQIDGNHEAIEVFLIENKEE